VLLKYVKTFVSGVRQSREFGQIPPSSAKIQIATALTLKCNKHSTALRRFIPKPQASEAEQQTRCMFSAK